MQLEELNLPSPAKISLPEPVPCNQPVLLAQQPRFAWLEVSFYLYMISVPVEVLGPAVLGLGISLALPFGLLFLASFMVRYMMSLSNIEQFRIPRILMVPLFFSGLCFVHYLSSSSVQGIGVVLGIFNNSLMAIVLYNYFCRRNRQESGLFVMGMTTVLVGLLVFAIIGPNGASGERFTVFDFDQNNFASILGFGVLIVATSAFFRRYSAISYVLFGGATVATIALIVASGSRGAMAALALSWLLFMAIVRPKYFYRPRNLAVGMLIILVGALLLFRNELSLGRWRSTFRGNETTAFSRRDEIVKVSLELIREKPLLGWGAYEGFREVGIRMGDSDYTGTHNTYMFIAVAGGIVGALPFVLFFAYPLKSFWRHRENPALQQSLVLYVFLLLVMLTLDFVNRKQIWILYPMILSSLHTCRLVTAPKR